MTRTTANRHLRRLLEEGKLRNIGKRMQPIYVLQRVITGCLVMCFGGKWKRFE